jgi:uncharacterized membrane protein
LDERYNNSKRKIAMSYILVSTSYWLHALATVVFIGHYLLLSLIYLPVFAKMDLSAGIGTALSAISKRSSNWLYASLGVFIVTGIYLTVADPSYLGLGGFRQPWAILMLVKHILILVMVGMGFWFNAIQRVGPLMSSNTGAQQALARFRWYSNAMAICGALVLLLTAVAQAQ